MEQDQHLDILKRVNRVSAPDYLYTRIEGKLMEPLLQKASPRLLWIAGVSCAVILFINVMAIQYGDTTGTDMTASSMSGAYNYQLYHD